MSTLSASSTIAKNKPRSTSLAARVSPRVSRSMLELHPAVLPTERHAIAEVSNVSSLLVQ
jgi:hypothetical protein